MAASVRSASCLCPIVIAGLFALSATSCGGPSSPEQQTEAQITSDTTWNAAQMGELDPFSGSGDSAVLLIGRGRQCATVTKTGSGSLTLRVGDDRSIIPNIQSATTRTVCGEGQLR